MRSARWLAAPRPVVVSLAVAKAVGDLFTESIYIVHCELDGVP